MKCLQFIRSYRFENKILSYTDLGVQRLILQNSEDELKDFIQEVLGPLMDYDHTRKGDLLTTLFVFLESNQNAKVAAETLHVHPNTLNYRIKRIEEILSIDLTDSKQLLNVHLAISVYQYIKDISAFSVYCLTLP
jgi:DNA-binding PucR family transcriptional regulator